ncbi:protein maelstrom homolog isoform X2 [Ptychodera flava]|uniref:protein maelstrom homolog isoform X2 n=1 Tax=Ptychodera flava TaxID=63121 RepID=UPI00396A9E44
MKIPCMDDETCTGQLISERIDPVAVNERRRREERQKVKENWPKGEGVVFETFFMIDVQSLCASELKEAEMIRYLPCEIACVEYSLNLGIQKAWHKFIEPPQIPLGFRFQCKNDSENTHQIPIQDFELAESDYNVIWQELVRFVNPLRNKEFPPVYCAMADCDKVDWSLDWLAYKAGVDNKLDKVYELEGLVCDLFQHGSAPAPSKHMAHELLTTSVFDYERDTRCPYHEELEVIYCSLGICKRHCFCLSDAFANIYNIELSSAHLPEKPDGCPYRVIEPHRLTLNVTPIQNKPANPRSQQPPSMPMTTTIVKPFDDVTRRKQLESDFGPFSQTAPKPPQAAGRGMVMTDSTKPLRRPYSVGIAASMSGVTLKSEKTDDEDWPTLGVAAQY